MKFNFKIPQKLKSYYQQEMQFYQNAFHARKLQTAWHHLERAHILGQAYPVEHTAVHWEMLRFGVRIKNRREVIGQIPRLLVGGIKSFVGNIPVGNTGGANVSPLQLMEIPSDLKELLRKGQE